ncbi:hypothetical protein N5J76_02915 [Pseudomonas sp. GD03855]|nr:hypothetical protein [Pseudomonas sp. GD03856]MDH2263870.1 hypothetical protein [Pseudomonas sp. GD03855]
MQIVIVCLLGLIAVILAPWLLGLIVAGIALYGIWMLVALALTVAIAIIAFAWAWAVSRRPSRMQQMINESNRMAQERDAKQGSEWKP